MKHTLKRILSAALACVMLLALLPASALAANRSTIKFTIENGYWKFYQTLTAMAMPISTRIVP